MNKPLKRIILYYVVGFATFIGNISIAWIIVTNFNIHYSIAVSIGFLFQIICAFFLNRKWTFKKHINAKRGLLVTGIVQTFSFIIVILLTSLGIEKFKLSFLISRISAGIIAGTIAYILDSYFTFKIPPLKK